MVSTEETRARRFQQGLNLELQRSVISFRYKTLAEVLIAAREHEQLSGLMRRVPASSLKRPIGHISGGDFARQFGATPPKRQIVVLSHVQPVECRFCHKMGHKRNEYRLANNLCLICGSAEHRASQCPYS